MIPKVKFISSVAELAQHYDAFILDLWGVVHDGSQLYPKVKHCLEQLRSEDKIILLLSNAPRRASAVEAVLTRMGVVGDLYDRIITSGETAYQCLAHPESSFFKPKGKHYIYIGLKKDQGILSGLHYEEVEHPEFAQFLLLSHSFADNQPMDELKPLLERCIAQKLPALCINPDIEVVRHSGERVYCAGLLAEEYRLMGGEVIYFGKPHRATYEACLRELVAAPRSRIIALGDNLMTDIKGAERTGLDSALVTGGILAEMMGSPGTKTYEDKCSKLFKHEGLSPTYVIPAFNW